jgi:hypothetical protein
MRFPFHWLRRTKTIQGLTMAHLVRQRVALDNEERRLRKNMAEVQAEDQRLLYEYEAARRSGEVGQQRFVARRLQEVREHALNLDNRHAWLMRQMRVTNGLMTIKDNEAFFLSQRSQLMNLDLQELQAWVEQATTQGELNMERLDMLLLSLGEANSHAAGRSDDLEGFMAALDQRPAPAGGGPVPLPNPAGPVQQ